MREENARKNLQMFGRSGRTLSSFQILQNLINDYLDSEEKSLIIEIRSLTKNIIKKHC